MSNNVLFKNTNTKNCKADFVKTAHMPKANNKYADIVPCIRIGTHSGANIIIYGAAEDGIRADFMTGAGFKQKRDLFNIFYDNFLVM